MKSNLSPELFIERCFATEPPSTKTLILFSASVRLILLTNIGSSLNDSSELKFCFTPKPKKGWGYVDFEADFLNLFLNSI